MVELSLVDGGLLSRFMRRIGLADRVRMQALVFPLVAWLPLAALSVFEGRAVSGVKIPFFLDYGVYGRLLVAVPLLVLAEIAVRKRTRAVLRDFVTAKLISEQDMPRFEHAVAAAARLSESLLPEAIALGAVYAVTALRIHLVPFEPLTTWYHKGNVITLAGWYYALASLPIFLFLLIRWIWRLAIWTGLLWKISRLGLQLLPIHPDGMGGLGFLRLAQTPFGLVGFAGGAVMSSYLIRGMIYSGGSLGGSVAPMAAYVILATFVILAPAFAFTDKLVEVRANGLLKYGDIGQEYARLFDEKWAKGVNPDSETILGSTDIQSLADLRNSLVIVQNMSVVAIDRKTIIIIAAAAAIPMLPLLLLAVPFEEIIARLLGLRG